MNKDFKRAEEATKQISEGREFLSEGKARAQGGSGLKMGEAVSNGGGKTDIHETQTKVPSPKDFRKAQNKTHGMGYLKNDITQNITKKKRILEMCDIQSRRPEFSLKRCCWIVTTTKIA